MVFINKLSDGINSVAEHLAIILLAVMSLLTFGGVIARYLFGSPIVWLYETTLVLFSWAIFLGVSIAFKQGAHIRLDLIDDNLSTKNTALVRTVIEIIVAIFLLIVVKDGIEIVINTMTQKYITLNLSIGWFTSAFPVCAVISLLHLVSRNVVKDQ